MEKCIVMVFNTTKLLRYEKAHSLSLLVFFTDYRDIKFKFTAHRLDSENRNTVL